MMYAIDLKEILTEISIENQFELCVYLTDILFDYSNMFIDDGDDSQYRRFLKLRNQLEHSRNSLSLIESSHFNLFSDLSKDT